MQKDSNRKTLKFNSEREGENIANEFLGKFERQKGRCVGLVLGWLLSYLKNQGIEFIGDKLRVCEVEGKDFLECGDGTYLYFSPDGSIERVTIGSKIITMNSAFVLPQILREDTASFKRPAPSSCADKDKFYMQTGSEAVPSNKVISESFGDEDNSKYEGGSDNTDIDSDDEADDDFTTFIRGSGGWMDD